MLEDNYDSKLSAGGVRVCVYTLGDGTQDGVQVSILSVKWHAFSLIAWIHIFPCKCGYLYKEERGLFIFLSFLFRKMEGVSWRDT